MYDIFNTLCSVIWTYRLYSLLIDNIYIYWLLALHLLVLSILAHARHLTSSGAELWSQVVLFPRVFGPSDSDRNAFYPTSFLDSRA